MFITTFACRPGLQMVTITLYQQPPVTSPTNNAARPKLEKNDNNDNKTAELRKMQQLRLSA